MGTCAVKKMAGLSFPYLNRDIRVPTACLLGLVRREKVLRQSQQTNVGNGVPGFSGTQSNLITQPLQMTTPIPPQLPTQPTQTQHKRPLLPIFFTCLTLLIISMLVLVGMNLNSLLPTTLPARPAQASGQVAPANNVVGHVFFMSSGQVNETSSQGIADEVEIDLSHIVNPARGNAYYAWLLGDNPVEDSTLLLGVLNVQHGVVHLQYMGDTQHTNLLAFASRFLITEEPSSPPPTVPSPDTRTWRYSAAFPRTPNPLDKIHHFGLLDHLRHLLALDPTMQELGLPGGLDIWLFRNVQKILEWAGSARDDWSVPNTDFMHRQFIRILDYLDGLKFVQRDVPLGTPVLVDPHIAQVGLLEFDAPNQEPPGLLYHIGIHLNGLVQSPGASPAQQQLATAIDNAINKVQALLEQVHADAIKLFAMNAEQLVQPAALSILDDMVTNAQLAYTGQFDSTTGNIHNGVTQIHYAIELLATMGVSSGGNAAK